MTTEQKLARLLRELWDVFTEGGELLFLTEEGQRAYDMGASE